jgi:hypothetical protein
MSGNKVHDNKKKCGAKKKSGGTCGRPAGWGTDHPGTGRCKLHGGASTGPKTEEGKKRVAENALKHGAYSDRLLNEQEKEIYDLLWDNTIDKFDLDRDNALHMSVLNRACITYIKLLRLDEWEMEQRFVIVGEEKDPETMDLKPTLINEYDEDGEIVRKKYGVTERLRWAKTPNWEGHFAKYMGVLGLDKSQDKATAAVVDAVGWLWGNKSTEER